MKKIVLLTAVIILGLHGAAGATCNPAIPATTPTADFTVNLDLNGITDGTVTHKKTGLVWMRCADGQTWNAATSACDGTALTYTWQGSLQRAAAANTAGFMGFNDWRVPNIKELSSIVERQCNSPAINVSLFQMPSVQALFWSSTTFVAFATEALGVGMGSGSPLRQIKTASFYLRLVRGENYNTVAAQ